MSNRREALRVDRLDKLIAFIEESKTFKMSEFFWSYDSEISEDWCGTPACVAGHIAVITGKIRDYQEYLISEKNILEIGTEYLMTNSHHSNYLFGRVDWDKEKVLLELRVYRDTGRWSWQ